MQGTASLVFMTSAQLFRQREPLLLLVFQASAKFEFEFVLKINFEWSNIVSFGLLLETQENLQFRVNCGTENEDQKVKTQRKVMVL